MKLASQIRHGCLWEFLLRMRLDESILERRRNGFLAAVLDLKRFFVVYYKFDTAAYGSFYCACAWTSLIWNAGEMGFWQPVLHSVRDRKNPKR
ncbi:hypothetical protein TNCT_144201 [Trichonephila clavata]|uniref:Uncharacterized protein n=1 Tax=Trichonephila clavata TaxID=2740835 RepID=A0A8X6FY77_TRICU|nr:hypothetical protein TNCT_144201 [Trichonephila clavata]